MTGLLPPYNQDIVTVTKNIISLEEAEDIIDFFHTLCHELATPLSLLMAVDDIEPKQLSEPNATSLEDIRAAKESLFQVLKNLKALRAPQAEKESIFYLSEVLSLDSIKEIPRVQLKGKQIRYQQFFSIVQKHFPILSSCRIEKQEDRKSCVITLQTEPRKRKQQKPLIESGAKLLALSCNIQFSLQEDSLEISLMVH